MKTKNIKIITSIIISILIISLTATVFALKPSEVEIDGELNDGGEMKEFGEKTLGIIQTVGIVGSVIILMVAGIKYMTGSVEEKADYKKALLPYVVGAILLFSATTIANMIYQVAIQEGTQSNNGSESGPIHYDDPIVNPGEEDLHTRE